MPVNVLTINSGSSSVRLAAFSAHPLQRTAETHLRRPNDDPGEQLAEFLRPLPAPAAVAHRVVHGGGRFTQPVTVDAQVEAEIERLARLAPLHNPRALEWIRACRRRLGAGVLQVAVFDTALYAQLPEIAHRYALPRALADAHGLRRYGFHGLAHEAMWRRWCALRPGRAAGGRVISLQLGGGCSVTAVRDGRAVDTSMGFSPLEGLVMATRCGDLDPGLLLYLEREAGFDAAALDRMLNGESGLLGLSGRSADMRELLESEDPAARVAVDVYCYRARKYVGAYLAALGSADAVLFGGGVGEHAPAVRARILAGLDALGIVLDARRNDDAQGSEACVSADASPIEVWVVPVDESEPLARAALEVLDGK
jgi:acetate kinase